jgi:hypothetical protein
MRALSGPSEVPFHRVLVLERSFGRIAGKSRHHTDLRSNPRLLRDLNCQIANRSQTKLCVDCCRGLGSRMRALQLFVLHQFWEFWDPHLPSSELHFQRLTTRGKSRFSRGRHPWEHLGSKSHPHPRKVNRAPRNVNSTGRYMDYSPRSPRSAKISLERGPAEAASHRRLTIFANLTWSPERSVVTRRERQEIQGPSFLPPSRTRPSAERNCPTKPRLTGKLDWRRSIKR